MRVFDAPAIRNVALAGHSGAGKTQLASALLFTAGAVNRLGKVDEGTTVTDYDEEAIARKHTLGSSLAWLEWHKTKINLIDTPGVGNLLSDTRGALRVVEAVARRGRRRRGRPGPDRGGLAARRRRRPAAAHRVNRLDRERASLDRTLESLRAAFGRAVVPIALPIGAERGFQGVVNLLTMQAMTYLPDGSGAVKIWAIPASLAAESAAARETLVELVAEADDALMARFFDEGTLTNEELAAGLARAVADCKIFPRAVHVGPDQRGDAAAARRPRAAGPLPRRPAVPRRRQGRHRDDHRRHRQRPDDGVRLAHRRRSLRRTHHAVPGRHRPPGVGHHRQQRDPRRRRRAPRPSAGRPRQDAHRGARSESRRSRVPSPS